MATWCAAGWSARNDGWRRSGRYLALEHVGHRLGQLGHRAQQIRQDLAFGGIERLGNDRLDQVREFLALDGVDHILLDNMSLDDLREAVAMRGERTTPMFEASGGVTLETIRDIAATGVDFISVGALTHSAPALDIGLDFTPLEIP